VAHAQPRGDPVPGPRLKRLRDAGKAESVEGKWRLTEEPAPREPPPRWTTPLRGTDLAATAHLTAAS